MGRTNFYNISVVEGNREYDHLYNTITKFTMVYPVRYYRVESEDLMCPDLISKKVYNTEDYWWIICMVNNIDNPFNDMEVGQLLKIPNLIDIYTFTKKWSIR